MPTFQPVKVLAATFTLAGSIAYSALAISNPVFTTPVDNQYGFASFDVGSTTYNQFTIATTTSTSFGQDGWNGGSSDSTGEPASPQDSLNDAYITTNVFGLGNNVIFDLNTTVNDGEEKVFYLTEHIGNDTFTITPYDDVGAISSWTLQITGADFVDLADANTTPSYDWNNEGNAIAGVAFSLADFTGGAGTLTGVTRLEIDGGGNLDPSQIGVAAIPEPGTLALVGIALGSLLFFRRRR